MPQRLVQAAEPERAQQQTPNVELAAKAEKTVAETAKQKAAAPPKPTANSLTGGKLSSIPTTSLIKILFCSTLPILDKSRNAIFIREKAPAGCSLLIQDL